MNLFNPSMVVLDSRLGLAGPGLLDQITKVVRRQALTYTSGHAALRFGQLGEEAGVLGVALVVIDQHFEAPVARSARPLISPVAEDSAVPA